MKNKPSYDECVQMYIDQEIDLLQFIDFQQEQYADFDIFLKGRALERTNDNAFAYLQYLEETFIYDEPLSMF